MKWGGSDFGQAVCGFVGPGVVGDLLIFRRRHMILYISRGSEHIAVLETCMVHLRLFDAEWRHWTYVRNVEAVLPPNIGRC